MKEFKFKIGGTDYLATVEDLRGGNMQVTVNGQTYQVEIPQNKAQGPRPAASAPVASQAGGPKNVVSELPGTVTAVKATAGQHVKRGDVLLVIEAMKMANDIVAEVDGTVKRVAVSAGQSVNQGDLLVEMVADAVAAPVAAPAAAPKAAPAAAAPVTAAPTLSPAAVGAKSVTAPLPGSITKINVKVGDTVAAGDTVLMMEAMKMENSISAEFGGTVKAILCKEGDQVQSGQALVELA